MWVVVVEVVVAGFMLVAGDRLVGCLLLACAKCGFSCCGFFVQSRRDFGFQLGLIACLHFDSHVFVSEINLLYISGLWILNIYFELLYVSTSWLIKGHLAALILGLSHKVGAAT